jgi:hypothetical protein
LGFVLFGVTLALAGGCIIAPSVYKVVGGAGGNADVPYISGTATGAGAGGGLGFPDGGVDVNAAAPVTSYQYLCGSSSSICVPGTTTDLCAPGGNPGVGGSAPDASALSCRLVSADGGPVVAQCGLGGSAIEGDPCTSSSDCAAELGCVASGTIQGICRNYCCASLESCSDQSTYCVKSPMAEAPANQIPVCVPAMKCVLLDDSTCPPGLTCTIVRESGTTSCVPPAPAGMGTYGEPCPCAAGFTCSWADGTCLQLCHTNSTECGENGYCQGGLQPYPMGIGYCVWY